MSASVIEDLKKSPAEEAEILYSFIRKNGYVSSNSTFVDTEEFKKGKYNYLLYVDYTKVGVIRDHKSRGFFSRSSKRPVIGIIFTKEKPWTLKVFGKENYNEMLELANRISEHFDVSVKMVLNPSEPNLEEYASDIWRRSSHVGRF